MRSELHSERLKTSLVNTSKSGCLAPPHRIALPEEQTLPRTWILWAARGREKCRRDEDGEVEVGQAFISLSLIMWGNTMTSSHSVPCSPFSSDILLFSFAVCTVHPHQFYGSGGCQSTSSRSVPWDYLSHLHDRYCNFKTGTAVIANGYSITIHAIVCEVRVYHENATGRNTCEPLLNLHLKSSHGRENGYRNTCTHTSIHQSGTMMPIKIICVPPEASSTTEIPWVPGTDS